MSGVKVGTRLEQLVALRARLDHEIDAERRRAAVDSPTRATPPRPRRAVQCNAVDQRLEALGVTSREVKLWALEAGHLDHMPRGRIGGHLVQLFVEARDRLNECVRAEA